MSASPPVAVPRIRSALFRVLNEGPSQGSRLVLHLVSALCAALVLWAALARVDIVAVAEGRLVPQTYVKIVQPAEAGIVREIRVREGMRVKADEVLLRLDPTLASADRRSSSSQLALKQLEIRRIDAQLAGRVLETRAGDDPTLLTQVRLDGLARERAYQDELSQERAALMKSQSELAAAREVVTKLERTLPSYMQSAEAYQRLAKEKLVGALDADAKQREAVEHDQDLKSQQSYASSLESAVLAQTRKLAQLESAYRSSLQSERSQRVGEVNQLIEEVQKQGFREGLLELRAPQAGVVKELAARTVGSVVQPGAVLLTLVPENEPLRAEVYIRNEDVGFVREGQSVRIKLAAYPFTRYGLLEGTLGVISADAAQANPDESRRASADDLPSESTSPFRALVNLSAQQLQVNGVRLPMMAGMRVSAEIIERDRTVLEYLLSPVRGVLDEAGRER